MIDGTIVMTVRTDGRWTSKLAPRCSDCGAILSRYRNPDEPADLCATCATKQRAETPQAARVLNPEALVLAAAGVLLLGAALHPGERSHIQAELADLGVLTDNDSAHKAVDKLRRRYGWRVFGVSGKAGYELIRWPYRFTRRRRRPQLQLFREGIR